MPGTRPPYADAAAWDVLDRHGLQLLHAAREFVRGRGQADASDGRRDHRSLLDNPGTVVVSCATAMLDTPQAAWAPLACVETPERAVVLMTTVKCRAIARAATLPYGQRSRVPEDRGMRGLWRHAAWPQGPT